MEGVVPPHLHMREREKEKGEELKDTLKSRKKTRNIKQDQ